MIVRIKWSLEKAIFPVFETQTVGPCLVQKFKSGTTAPLPASPHWLRPCEYTAKSLYSRFKVQVLKLGVISFPKCNFQK